MYEHRVSAYEAAARIGIAAQGVIAAIKCGRYDEQGQLVGPKPEDSRSGRAAIYVKGNDATLSEAAEIFGVTRQAVQQAWVILFPEEPVPSRLMTSLRIQQVIELASDERTIKEVASELDMTYGAVQQICAREGIATRPAREVAAELNEQIVAEVMKGGRTIPEIAAEFDISPEHVQKLMTERGLRVPRRFGGNHNRGKSAEALELMKREHLSVREAAKRFKIAPGSLRSYIMRREREAK